MKKNIRTRITADGTVRYNAQVRRKGYGVKSKTFDTEQQAHDWVYDQERDIRERAVDPRKIASRHNVAGMVEAYLAEVKPTHKSYKDTEARCNFFAERLGNVKLTELSSEMVQDALSRLACADATKNRYLGAFSGCITQMSKQTSHRPSMFIGANPCKLITRGQESRGRQRVIKAREWKLLMKHIDKLAAKSGAARKQQLPNFMRLAYETGRRRGELLDLTWSCIDFDDGIIHLLDTKTGDDQEVVMTDEIRALMEDHEERFKKKGHKHVFRGRVAGRPTNFDEPIRTAFREVIEPDFRGEMPVFHTVRHTAATEMGNAGATETEIMAVTGHKTSVTVQRYVKKTRQAAESAQAKRKRSKA
jgi:integrase